MTIPINNLAASAKALQSGELDPQDYLDLLEKRIDERETGVKAFLEEEGRFTRLREQAQALLEQYPEPDNRPVLFGIPVGVKDIFTVRGFDTRAGSQLPAKEFKSHEAESIKRLKDAGALILGKTISAEFAYIAPGVTCNPHNEGHTPGGSSSGSAAAVGAGMCALSLGTQTVGSINRPAAYCGVVGFKPSYERISRVGVVPVSESLDHVGFFASDVQSAGLAASVLLRDWKQTPVDRQPVLAVPEGPYLERVSPEGRKSFEDTCEKLLAAGYEVKRISVMPDFDDIINRHMTIMSAEAAWAHFNWFGRYGHLYHEKTTELIRQGMDVPGLELKSALPGRENLRQELMAAMSESNIDLWVAPAATGTAPKGLESTGDSIMNLAWTHCGLPVLNLPSGKDENGLPFGLQLVGKWHEDESLLAHATGIEKALGFAV
jgi:Asp-tRNA(Asn)/Glu-tRNA(Gln) amidotransferase A subunit family amidase